MSRRRQTVRHIRMVLLVVTVMLTGCGGDGELGSQTGVCQTNCPIANAGHEQTVLMGEQVTLDGSGSTSSTDGVITYQWTLISKPAASAATLTGVTTASPTFTADVTGTYEAKLVVDNGGASSNPSSVTIACGNENRSPIADAGQDRTD